jgi:hypothetical protein
VNGLTVVTTLVVGLQAKKATEVATTQLGNYG